MGGAFGRQGYALSLIYDKISQSWFDEIVDLGGGAGKTRRKQLCETFKSSFDFGAGTRKTITNQVMENDASVYGAALALYKLDPITYASYPTIGLRMIQEACGVEEFTGVATNLSGTNPQLGTPATSNRGAGYFWMTKKGTSHEPGWVSPDCYGNLGGKMMEMYKMTVHHLGGDGDKRILDMAVKHVKTQSMFTYPYVAPDGKRDILSEGFTCVRNIYVPGKRFYGNIPVAAISADEVLMGYLKQQIEDGRLEDVISNNFQHTSTQYAFKALENLISSNSSDMVPTTPGLSDFFFADEENGIVSIKRGSEQLMLNFFYRDNGDNRLVRGHHITGQSQRFIEVYTNKTEFRSSGVSKIRDSRVNGFNPYFGTPPDNPTSANTGQIEYFNSYDGTSKYDGNRLLKDYYMLHYGNYVVAMNTMQSESKTIEFPTEVVGKSAYQFHTQTQINIPATMSLPPRSTYVYILDEQNQGGLISSNPTQETVDKSILNSTVSEKEGFAQAPTTSANISLVGGMGKYKHEVFLDFMRALSYAKAVNNRENAPQSEVDAAVVELNTAYNSLITNVYSYDVSEVPGDVDFSKKIAQAGAITVNPTDIGSTKNNSYVVIPVQANVTGDYTITIKANSGRPSSVLPRANIALLNDGTDYAAYQLDSKNTLPIATNGWNIDSEYKWSVSLNAGDLKLLRVTFLVNDGSWVCNINQINFRLSTSWDLLLSEISDAQKLLADYSNQSLPEYSLVREDDRTILTTAITQAQKITENNTGDEIADARQLLSNAVLEFRNAISTINRVSGYFDFSLYDSVSSSNIIVKKTDIGSTKNNAYVVYKFRANQSGRYLPAISASTNTDPTMSPKVMLSISSNPDFTSTRSTASLYENTSDIVKGPSGWNSYSIYSYPEVNLLDNQDYYLKLTFLTQTTWCANVNSLNLSYQGVATTIKEVDKTESDLKIYPNPAFGSVNINLTSKETATIGIYDLAGRLQLKHQIYRGVAVLDISKLESGIYFVKDMNSISKNMVKLIVR